MGEGNKTKNRKDADYSDDVCEYGDEDSRIRQDQRQARKLKAAKTRYQVSRQNSGGSHIVEKVYPAEVRTLWEFQPHSHSKSCEVGGKSPANAPPEISPAGFPNPGDPGNRNIGARGKHTTRQT